MMRKAMLILALFAILISCDPMPEYSEGLTAENVVVSINESIANISWTVPEAGEPIGYRIYIDKSSEPSTEIKAGICNAALDISDLRSGEHIVVVKAVYEDGSIEQGAPLLFQYNKPEETVQNLRAGLDSEKSGNVLLSWDSPEKVDDVLSLEIRMDANGPISIRPDNTSFSFSMLGVESGEHEFSITTLYGGMVRSIAKIVLLYAAES